MITDAHSTDSAVNPIPVHPRPSMCVDRVISSTAALTAAAIPPTLRAARLDPRSFSCGTVARNPPSASPPSRQGVSVYVITHGAPAALIPIESSDDPIKTPSATRPSSRGGVSPTTRGHIR
ncbi:MAG: hypothetical protein R3F14_23015 [Polyangiaceae bacterium]